MARKKKEEIVDAQDFVLELAEHEGCEDFGDDLPKIVEVDAHRDLPKVFGWYRHRVQGTYFKGSEKIVRVELLEKVVNS